MKKIISLIAVLFTAIVLTSCFGELESLEWSQLPESVYEVVDQSDHELAVDNFMAAAKVKINGKEVTLKEAVENHGATVTGFDLTSEGSKVITVKYASLTIYWAYQVIDGEITPDEVTPTYDWYDDQSSPYTLASIGDLYGFANIVNGKRPDHSADSFAGKTVKLGANIDLTGKVWEPIGAAPRKRNVPLTPLFDLTDLENLFIDNDKLFTGDTFNLTSNSAVEKTSSPVANQIYFDVEKTATSSQPITISICNTFEKYGVIAENRRSFITITKQELIALGGTDAERLAELKARVIAKLQEQITAGAIYNKYFIAPEIYAEAVSEATDNSVLLNTIYYEFTYSGDIAQGNFFSGTFDGQGHKIIGLSDVGYTPTVVLTYANSSTIVTGYTFGLFGVVNGNVTVKNVTFEEVSVVGAYYEVGGGLKTAEIDSVGSAIGYSFGIGDLTIDNVNVLTGSINAFAAAGGVVGRIYNYGDVTIQNCTNRANISSAEKHTGGIAGFIAETGPTGGTTNDFDKKIINCTNYGNVSALKSHAGAIVRYMQNGKTKIVDNCRNFGNITGTITTHGMTGQTQTVNPNCVNYGILREE